jgi:hypothetical protein
MTTADRFNAIIKHVWTEPRFAAEAEWYYENPGLAGQLMGQGVSREELEGFIDGNGWVDPDREVTFVVHEPPDWDWWEPTTRWRRLAARDREFDAR